MRHLSKYEPKSFLSSDGVLLYYERGGGGLKTLFFIHGLGGDLSAWDKEREFFHEKGFSTIALDLRGHGMSGRPESKESYSMKRFSEDILELIRKENLKDFFLVGHSFGGMITINLQGIFLPDSKALVLVDTTYKPPHWSDFIMHNKVLENVLDILADKSPNIKLSGNLDYEKFKNATDKSVTLNTLSILHTGLRSFLESCNALTGFDAKDLLKKINVPTLIIEGTNDHNITVEEAVDLSKRIRNSHLDFIKGDDHVLVINDPARLEEEIYKFVQKV